MRRELLVPFTFEVTGAVLVGGGSMDNRALALVEDTDTGIAGEGPGGGGGGAAGTGA